MKKYILKVKGEKKYVGRGIGNDANPSAYGLVDRPSPEDWRNSKDLCGLEAMNWLAHARRTGAHCPQFEIAESNF